MSTRSARLHVGPAATPSTFQRRGKCAKPGQRLSTATSAWTIRRTVPKLRWQKRDAAMYRKMQTLQFEAWQIAQLMRSLCCKMWIEWTVLGNCWSMTLTLSLRSTQRGDELIMVEQLKRPGGDTSGCFPQGKLPIKNGKTPTFSSWEGDPVTHSERSTFGRRCLKERQHNRYLLSSESASLESGSPARTLMEDLATHRRSGAWCAGRVNLPFSRLNGAWAEKKGDCHWDVNSIKTQAENTWVKVIQQKLCNDVRHYLLQELLLTQDAIEGKADWLLCKPFDQEQMSRCSRGWVGDSSATIRVSSWC